MHRPANLSFERVVHEFAQWRAVPEAERCSAPAWWWGPAFEALGSGQAMPAGWCADLGLPEDSTLAAGAHVILAPFGEQNLLPWTGDFPYRVRYVNSP